MFRFLSLFKLFEIWLLIAGVVFVFLDRHFLALAYLVGAQYLSIIRRLRVIEEKISRKKTGAKNDE